jgi:predicted permease
MRNFLYAFRTLRKSPTFFVIAVVTLGLGIAANTAMFSLFYQVLLATLPVPDPQRLVVLHSDAPSLPGGVSSDNSETVFSYPLYRRLRDTLKSFEGLAARSSTTVQVGVEGAADRGRGELVSGNFFDTLKVRPSLGRLLNPQDDTAPGANRVAVLSYDFWVTRFGASPAVLNRTILLNTQPFTIVGVTPRGFRGVLSGDAPTVFLPISAMTLVTPGLEPVDESPSWQWLTVIGRLRSGIPRERALAELQPIFVATIQDHVRELKVKSPTALARFAAKRADLRPAAQGLNELERQWRSPLFVLLIMASVLLLIACANLANLLAVRATNRKRELSVRLALGATRSQIVVLLLAESAALALCGTATGLALTPLMNRMVLSTVPQQQLNGWVSDGLDWHILAFSALTMIAITLLCGFVPSLQTIGGGLSERAAGAGRNSAVVRRFVVSLQVALSMALLIAAGLFARSLGNLMRHDPGFRPDSLLTFSMDAGLNGYTADRGRALYDDVQRKLRALPGVSSVSISDAGPLSHSSSSTNVMVEGYTPKDDENMDARLMAAGSDYFRTLGTPLLQGREFNDRDDTDSPHVAVVNQAFLRRFFGGQHAVGHHMSRGSGVPLDITIVGEVSDSQNTSYREPAGPTYYVPYNQNRIDGSRSRRATFFVRSASAPAQLERAVRSIAAAADATVPIYAMETMTARVAEFLFTDRITAGLATAFGLLALLLTAVGLYGVIAYAVSRRTTEIGVRMALGATRSNIISSVLKEALLMLASGTFLGLSAAWAAGRGLESQLFGLHSFDLLVFVGAPAIVAVVTLFAASVPAMRAAGVEPVKALRHE